MIQSCGGLKVLAAVAGSSNLTREPVAKKTASSWAANRLGWVGKCSGSEQHIAFLIAMFPHQKVYVWPISIFRKWPKWMQWRQPKRVSHWTFSPNMTGKRSKQKCLGRMCVGILFCRSKPSDSLSLFFTQVKRALDGDTHNTLTMKELLQKVSKKTKIDCVSWLHWTG